MSSRRLPGRSEAERESRGEEELRAVTGPGELGSEADVPDQLRRHLISKADLGTHDVVLSVAHGLLGEHVGDQRRARVLRSAQRVAGAQDELVATIAFSRADVDQKLVRSIQM